MDDFWEPVSNLSSPASTSGLASQALSAIYKIPANAIITAIIGFIGLIIFTRLFSGRSSEEIDGQHNRSAWMPPYWVPVIGHGFSFLSDPAVFMAKLRDQSPHGIFALNLGATTHTIISNPSLVKGVMQQKESSAQIHLILTKFFNLTTRKWEPSLEELMGVMGYLMKEPHLGNFMKVTVRGIEEHVPNIFSFMEGEVDQHSWERWASARYINEDEEEINLNAVLRDIMGQVSVPALFGQAFFENNPDILHDVYDFDSGMMYFLMGLPWFTPWPSVIRAHLGRWRLRESMTEFSKALEDTIEGKAVDSKWDNMDDVKYGFSHKERGDISMLWAMVVNATALVYWQVLYIFATPGLLDRVRNEIAPYAQVTKPTIIGTISESPGLKIDQEGLAKNCPLFRATYLESLRLSSQPWSVRKVAKDVSIPLEKQGGEATSYVLKSGGYITLPHDLHMRDPKYFKDPEKFVPERFLYTKEDGTISTDIGTIRPYGGGPSMCKGRQIAERECMAFVAAVVMYWDMEPADSKKTWVIPAQKKTSAVSLPVQDSRVRVKRRVFKWD
ncbi:hypothetical protein B7463_g423, partial [Scytalidium lignicola]